MATVTHSIHIADLHCEIDLDKLANTTINIIRKNKPFNVCIWNSRKIKSTCLVYHTGRILVHGPRMDVRKYARLLYRLGFDVKLRFIKLVTQSMSYTLNRRIIYKNMIEHFNIQHNPEIFHALIFKRGGVNFTCHRSGKILITGVRHKGLIASIVDPTILEICLCN